MKLKIFTREAITMKKLLTLILASLFLTACGAASLVPGGAAAESKPKAGDTVVAKWAGGSFYEGKVDKIDGSKITVAWLDNSTSTVVDAADVYQIPAKGTKTDAKVGDMVLTKTGTATYWEGAEVTAVEGDVVKVKPVSATTSVNVPSEKVIKVSSATIANFKEKAGATDFLKEAQKMKPATPAAYKPRKGDKVIAEWTTNTWYEGTIDNISGSNIYVAWQDMSKPSAVNLSKVVPAPTSETKEMPKAEQYLLIKPDNGSRWEYAQTTKINGGNVDVKLSAGQTKTIRTGEFLLLN
jgi:hypothetical protein